MTELFTFLTEKDILGEVLLASVLLLGFVGYKLVLWYITKDKPQMMEAIQGINTSIANQQKHFDKKFDDQQTQFRTVTNSLQERLEQTDTQIQLMVQSDKARDIKISDHETRIRANETDLTKVKERTRNVGINTG